jgi:tRNA(His) guanylyltransferase
MFDGRAVVYPTLKNIIDYFSWRQVDCHINNLYNTLFWSMVLLSNIDPQKAEATIKDTNSAIKNEMLFKNYSINYNNEPE